MTALSVVQARTAAPGRPARPQEGAGTADFGAVLASLTGAPSEPAAETTPATDVGSCCHAPTTAVEPGTAQVPVPVASFLPLALGQSTPPESAAASTGVAATTGGPALEAALPTAQPAQQAVVDVGPEAAADRPATPQVAPPAPAPAGARPAPAVPVATPASVAPAAVEMAGAPAVEVTGAPAVDARAEAPAVEAVEPALAADLEPAPAAPEAATPQPAAVPSAASTADVPEPRPSDVLSVAPSAPAPAPAAVAPTPAPLPGPAAVPAAVQVAAALAPVLEGPDGSYSLSLQLYPEELGAVQVEISVRNGEVSLALRAAEPAAVEVLRSAVSDLRGQLESTGLTSADVSVDLGRGDGAPADERRTNRGTRTSDGTPTEQADEPATSPSDSDSALDVRI